MTYVGERMLPRIVYVGDVPVEASYHGSALLYRLLETYTAAGIKIVETGRASAPERRLSNVSYSWSPLGESRWMRTRFHPFVSAYNSVAANRCDGPVAHTVYNTEFDCVLTVAHGFGWLSAAALAQSRRTPLHVVIHDDWVRVAHVPLAFRSWLDRRFREVYRQAQSRLCVSPAMRDRYRLRYGEDGEVLYPIRAKSCPIFEGPPARLDSNDHRFTVAFAGTINTPGYVQTLKDLQAGLARINGRLLVYGPLTRSEAKTLGLDLSHLVLGGLLESRKLIERLREQADALFVPMSFSKADRMNMEMSFPSKLTDYTAVGLPLLIYGPNYCSAVRWSDENPGTSEMVRVEDEDVLATAVQRLASSATYRRLLGRRALEVGNRYFSYDRIQSVFDRALMSFTTQKATPTVSASSVN